MKRHGVVVCVCVFALMLSGLASPAGASSASQRIIQVWYAWGNLTIGGAQVATFASTNLTFNETYYEANGTSVQEITEFHTYMKVPGRDRWPAANGSDPDPYPSIWAFYDTTQVIRDPSQCIPSNNSVGFVCGAPTDHWEHQVLQLRFVRLVEFADTNGDGGYQLGEAVRSQQDLTSTALQWRRPFVQGLSSTGEPTSLPIRSYPPQGAFGEAWVGWLGQNEEAFGSYRGLVLQTYAGGAVNLSVTAFQWFEPRVFQGQNLTPLQVKLDIRIAGYPFVATDSRLAVELNVTSFSQGISTDWEVVPWPEGQGLAMDAAVTQAIFAWASSATADGMQTPVAGTSVAAGSLSRHVYLAYPHATVIEHDPVLGILDKRGPWGRSILVGPVPFSVDMTWVAFGATVAVSAAALYVLERRKR